MKFWSKGLGKLTVDLHLNKGTTVRSSGMLYLSGQMEAPVDWEYIMPLDEEDIVDFMALLRDPSLADYVATHPRKWQIYGGMIVGGLQLASAVVKEIVQSWGAEPEPEAAPIQVPPPIERKKKGAKKRPARRRLGSKTLTAPSAATPASDDAPKAEAAAG